MYEKTTGFSNTKENKEEHKQKKEGFVLEQIIGNVFETNDYDRFKFISGNRKINHNLVKSISQSMLRHGWKGPAIICKEGENGALEIADGQHRFTAAKSQGIPVRYEIDNDISLSQIQNMNNIVKTWNNKDFIQSYCDMGNEHYIALREMMEKHPRIPLTCIAPMCCGKYTVGGTQNQNTNTLRNGNYKFDMEHREEIDKVLTEIERYSDSMRKIGGRTDCIHYALGFALRDEKVSWERLYSQFMKEISTFSPVHSTGLFLKEMSAAYNRNLKKGERIHLDVEWEDR